MGYVLRADSGTWRARRWRPTSITFQWRLCTTSDRTCEDIVGATDRIYALRAEDSGHTLRAVVTATNAAGKTSAVSGYRGPVRPAKLNAPVAATRPTIAGTPKVPNVLAARIGTWSGAALTGVAYAWRRCNAQGGACVDTKRRGERYTLEGADAGHAFRVLVTVRNDLGVGAALSPPTEEVEPAAQGAIAPRNTRPPVISGVAQQGQTLHASTGSWTGTPPLMYAFQWFQCGVNNAHCRAIARATTTSYNVPATVVGRRLRIRVTARNAAGAASILSAPTRAVRAAPQPGAAPRVKGQPVISGAAVAGSTLRTSNGTWSGTLPLSYRYRWLRCDTTGGGVNGRTCGTIPGETRSTYVLADADVGHRIRSKVVATNAFGTASFNSNPTPVVSPRSAPPQNTQVPTISGRPVANTTLTASTGGWTGTASITYTYQWRRCDKNGGSCSDISGATAKTYLLTSADENTTIRVRVTAHNSAGSSSATSAPTGVVAKAEAPVGSAIVVNDVSLPNRLLVDRVAFRPQPLRSRRTFTARFHVADSHGHSVQGALVFVVALPFGTTTTPPEAATGPDGWVTFRMRPTRRVKFGARATGIQMFVRARKAGDRLIGGISTRRLVNLSTR